MAGEVISLIQGRKRSRSAAELRAEILRFKRRKTSDPSEVIDLTAMEDLPTNTVSTENTTWKKLGNIQLLKKDRYTNYTGMHDNFIL